jgi:SAM-dependent methyltransferase
VSRRLGAVLAAIPVVGAIARIRRERRNPSPCPYAARAGLAGPRPFFGVRRLLSALEPRPGQTVLELGPGTGYYSLDVAERLLDGGTLHLFDVQQEMLDHTMARARERRLDNLVPTRGDAVALPYADGTFDAAFMITVLGEIPDRARALRELHRVLKPGGRLVIGEIAGDPHFLRAATVRREAEVEGFRFGDRIGPAFAYFACFERLDAD